MSARIHMVKPDFIIVGAMRAGTTTFAAAIAHDPRIFMPRTELHYFSDPARLKKGMDWYLSHFAHAHVNHASRVGEKSATYHFAPGAIERIAEALPDVRIAFILRDPLRRAYSHYWHAVINGAEKRPFLHCLREGRLQGQNILHDYVGRSRYGAQLERMYQTFDRSRVFVCFLEEFKKAPQSQIESFQRYVGLLPQPLPAPEHRHHRTRIPRLPWLQHLAIGTKGNRSLIFRGLRRMNVALGPETPAIPNEAAEMFRTLIADDEHRLRALTNRPRLPWE